ncbi:HAMP domain-containing sensor histidine kinase [Corynebacterium callunae]|uniref:ATP-binding protein n=1 Tax=Corynebacterium callunae TaxID=1721 RepID=UPI003981E404
MTLRRIELDNGEKVSKEPHEPGGWSHSTSLRWRLSLLSATLVAIAVGIITIAAYWTVSSFLTAAVDRDLEQKAETLLSRAQDPSFYADVDEELGTLKAYNTGLRVAFAPPHWDFVVGDSIALPTSIVLENSQPGTQLLNTSNERILVKKDESGAAVILAKDIASTHRLNSTLGILLLTIGGVGVLVSIFIGFFITNAGLRPLVRLQNAVEEIARTDDLRAIPVVGNDELARLTVSFNDMLKALRESRQRQSQFVADAGHELKTPLTSMRTNIELLMMSTRPDMPAISPQDREDLERDVRAQLTEMSTLIGDLVDLAREEGSEASEKVQLEHVLDTALGRVASRRLGVEIKITESMPWTVSGDEFSLTRALVNVLDNAIKWSPENGVVRVAIKPLSEDFARITVEDSGPGISPDERELVFERFYRAVRSRSMPGSGLGLAIVYSVVKRHMGNLEVSESDDGGAKIIIDLPGTPGRDFES